MMGWLVETLFAVTVLMLVVLAARKPVAHFFGAGWAYALWLLPALRLILPPLHIFGAGMPSILSPSGDATAVVAPGQVSVPLQSDAFMWEPALLGLWAMGAAIFIGWQIYSYLAFMKRLGIGSQVHASLAQDIGIVETREVDGPLAIGFLDRWIVVPADFTTRYSAEEQRLALRHERIHHQREDILWNMVALLVLALNWFNPVAYAAFRAFRNDQELSCDAAVAAQASGTERHDYARALVKSASKPGLIAACPLNHAGQLKRRLRMMKDHRRGSLRALGGSTAFAGLLLAGITVTEAPGVAAPEPQLAEAQAPAATPGVRRAVTANAAVRAAAPRPQTLAALAPATRTSISPPQETTPVARAAPSAAVAEADEAPETQSEAPTPPSPLRQRFILHVQAPAPEIGAALGVHRVRLVRADLQRMDSIEPALKARLESLLARRAALSATGEIHQIIVEKNQEIRP